MALIVLLFSGVFGLIGSLALAHLVLRIGFRCRPSIPHTHQSFFQPSVIGALVTVPAMALGGFVLFSLIVQDVSIEGLDLGAEHA